MHARTHALTHALTHTHTHTHTHAHLSTLHYREPPQQIFNQTIMHIYHKGDVAKMQILMEYGGIYLDYDVIVLRSLDELRRFPYTVGKEKGDKFNAGVILAHKDSLFLKLW